MIWLGVGAVAIYLMSRGGTPPTTGSKPQGYVDPVLSKERPKEKKPHYGDIKIDGTDQWAYA